MRLIIFIVILLLLSGFHSTSAWSPNDAGISLSGRITDKASGEPMAGVYVNVPDLKTGGISDAAGNYIIRNLPQVKILVQLSFVGYKNILETVDLKDNTRMDFIMEATAVELNEVIISGSSKAQELKSNPTPVTVLHKLTLLQNSATNIIDAIATQPGVSQISTGPGISKPVIRGLGYNRVVVVNDGIRQEGQQWGDEHGIEIDENTVYKVEIIKGPASLAYGSDAMAGVINMISDPSLPDGKIVGGLSANYQSNNGLIGYSGNVGGNLKGITWDARYSNKIAHSYRNSYDGYVLNSGFRENAASGLIGLNKSWGYSHLTFGMYNITPGIIEGNRDSSSGEFIKPVLISPAIEGTEIATEKDFKSYDPLIPYQKIHHYKVVSNNNFIVGQGNLKTTIGFQQNQRQEYADILNPGKYGLFFLMNTLNYDAQYNIPEKKNFNLSFGINGMGQSSKNKGTEYLIPEYRLFDFGLFSGFKKSFSAVDISGGIRYDIRSEKSDDLYLTPEGIKVDQFVPGVIQKFESLNTTFSGFSGSIGITYEFSKSMITKFNISRGFRAPNIAELSANGVHEGTLRYETGNSQLKPEGSWQFDYALGFSSYHASGEINLFDNNINNYIFIRKLENNAGGDSIRQGYQAFTYTSGNAHLLGGEIRLDLHPHPLDWIHFENAFSYVNGILLNQPDSSRYLPMMPPPKFQSGIRTNFRKIGKYIENAYMKIELDMFFKQERIFSAYGTETMTPGYSILNIGTGTDFTLKGITICSIYLSVNNLADKAYQSHLSRLKYADINYVTGRTGVYNMGRNFSIKLIVPLNFKG
jgi:iron complex outermembrane receptor protein